MGNIAADLEIDVGCVNVKAKTNEGIGHIGRKEGIGATAVVMVSKSAASLK